MEQGKTQLTIEEVRKHLNGYDFSDEEIKEIIATLKDLAEIAYGAWQHLIETGQEESFFKEIREGESNPNKSDLQEIILFQKNTA